MVEGVQEIGAKLQAETIRYCDDLLHSDIPIPGPGTIHGVPFRVAPLPGLRRGEGRGIEPLHAMDRVMGAGLSRVNRAAGDGIRATSPPSDDTRRHSEVDRKRSARAIRGDAGNRPASDDAVQEFARKIESPTAPQGQVPEVIED